MTRTIGFLGACLLGVVVGGAAYVARPDLINFGASVPSGEAAVIAAERKRLLQDELSRLTASLNGASCNEQTPLLPTAPDGQPRRFAATRPVSASGEAAADARPTNASVGDAVEARLEDAVVMVVAPAKQGVSIGTGFFISPTLVVTNRHVIADLVGSTARVLWQNSAQPLVATLRDATSAPAAPNQFAPDFAVLELAAPVTVRPLAITTKVERLDRVIAAGFPNLAMTTDAAYQNLIAGRAELAPTIIMTEGRVAAVHTTSTGLQVLPHTAQISQGDSGGPLVDACGRIVGVNTFDLNAGANTVYYAQKSDALLAFLAEKKLVASREDTPCQANLDRLTP